MTTVSVIIQDAFYGSTIKGIDETIDNASMQLALRRFQRMMDSYANDDLMIYNTSNDSFTMTPSVNTYSTALLLTDGRPVSLDSIYLTLSNIDYDVDLIDQQKYDAIQFKAAQGIPNQCWYNPSFPDGEFHFYTTPYAAFLCTIVARQLITPAAMTLTSNIVLPAGYEKFMVDMLSVDIWPSFKGNAPVPADVKRAAKEAQGRLASTNEFVMEAVTPFDRSSNISNAFLYKGF